MDPLTALGTAANICQFVEYGFKLVVKVKEARRLGAIDPDIERNTNHLKRIVEELSLPSSTQTSGGIGDLAVECVKLSDDLLHKLAKVQPKSDSMLDNVKAVLKREQKKGEINQLKQQLDHCRAQLNLHLTAIVKQNLDKRLEEIRKSNQGLKDDLVTLLSTVENFRASTDSSHIGGEILQTIRLLVQRFDLTVEAVRQKLVLNALRFPGYGLGVHERFDDVEAAHEATFTWLLDDPPESNHVSNQVFDSPNVLDEVSAWTRREAKAQTKRKQEARECFISWLENDDGIFHVSGKPGAGKSTLMKYVCLHKNLPKLLQTWCGRAKLAVGYFFFWKPGSSEQKNTKGLLRGLLYSVLESCPHLVPVAFPDLWESTLYKPEAGGFVEARDIQEAFDLVLAHGDHKFAFFIDGLDECDGNPADLIRTLNAWSNRFTGKVKICVSSREYSVFLEDFSRCPRLRLHLLTFEDMSNMVAARLKDNNRASFTDSDIAHLGGMIVEKAEGVFLWVSLVLRTIEDGIYSGDDVTDLERKIKICPTELEELFKHLLRNIHPGDREWAFRALRFTLFLQNRSMFVSIGYGSWKAKATPRAYLLQLSFLDEYNRNVFFATQKMTQMLDASGEITARLNTTRMKVHGRCKGFLEIHKDEASWVPKHMGDHVLFTHRSLVEFLATPWAENMMGHYPSTFDPFNCVCSTFLALMKHQSACEYWQNNPHGAAETRGLSPLMGFYFMTNIQTYTILSIQVERAASEQFLEFLDSILCVMVDQTDSQLIQDSLWKTFALQVIASGCPEYLSRMIAKGLRIPLDNANTNLGWFRMFIRTGNASGWSEYSFLRFTETLSSLVSLGLDLNEPAETYGIEEVSGWTLWEHFLWNMVLEKYPEDWNYGALIDWFLRHGAACGKRQKFLRIASNGPRSVPWLNPKDGWVLLEPFPNRYPTMLYNPGTFP